MKELINTLIKMISCLFYITASVFVFMYVYVTSCDFLMTNILMCNSHYTILCSLLWWNTIRLDYIYSSTALKYRFEVLVVPFLAILSIYTTFHNEMYVLLYIGRQIKLLGTFQIKGLKPIWITYGLNHPQETM